MIIVCGIIGLAIQFYLYYFEVPDEEYLKVDDRTLKQKFLIQIFFGLVFS